MTKDKILKEGQEQKLKHQQWPRKNKQMKRNHAALTMSEYITLLFTLLLHLEVSEPAY